MDFYLNDFSIHGQLAGSADFLRTMSQLIGFKNKLAQKGLKIYCDQLISQRPACQNLNLSKAMNKFLNLDQKRTLLGWFQKGPFWQERRTHPADTYLDTNVDKEVVTDHVLGEAAWRVHGGEDCRTLSIDPSKYTVSPLIIRIHDDDSHLPISIINYWEESHLDAFLQGFEPEPRNWADILAKARGAFPYIELSPHLRGLEGQPFQQGVARAVLRRLEELNHYRALKTTDPAEAVRFQTELVSEDGRFSSASSTEKDKESDKMTFKNPQKGSAIFCPDHGKIKGSRQFRIHFNGWDADTLYIVYIGYKLTLK